MDKGQSRLLRRQLFFHLDGLALCGVIPVLDEIGVLERCFVSGGDVDELAGEFRANSGYLNVSLRMLCSQGFLEAVRSEDKVHFRPAVGNDPFVWFKHSKAYAAGRTWMKEIVNHWNTPEAPLEQSAIIAMDVLIDAWDDMPNDGIKSRIKSHLAGALVAPWLVTLGTIHGTRPISSWEDHDAATLKMHVTKQEAWGKVLKCLGWDRTEEGEFFLKRSAAYGVTTSYMKTFIWAKELIFGDGGYLWRIEPGDSEIHVDRKLNVWGSGGAHKAYFSHLDVVIKEIFNAPLETQPKGICDMGCGNGALLLHLMEVVENDTLRGKHLEDHPLILVGADFNKEALIATSQHFEQESVEGHFIWGDIGDPDRLALDLWKYHNVKLGDLLSVRSFLDHNRIFNRPNHNREANAISTGAFSFRGERLKLRDVEQSLKEHFIKWMPYVASYGLLLLELHTIDPDDAASKQGGMPATAYDATHGFADQYIVEIPVFDAMAKEAGLTIDESNSRTFPSTLPATVSIRFLKA
ncbi:MAG: polyketide synthase [Euryarchaeota archaeon]|nr:polyketide synthase [Euryarchaeota archaeon]